MNEEQALLAAIHANLEEDTPRLVYADWLQENEQEARAEFIRLQIEHFRNPKDKSWVRYKRHNRISELLTDNLDWAKVKCTDCDGTGHSCVPDCAETADCGTCLGSGDLSSHNWMGDEPIMLRGFLESVITDRDVFSAVVSNGRNEYGQFARRRQTGWAPSRWLFLLLNNAKTVRSVQVARLVPTLLSILGGPKTWNWYTTPMPACVMLTGEFPTPKVAIAALSKNICDWARTYYDKRKA